jgi:parallel beta-helix repeat protein
MNPKAWLIVCIVTTCIATPCFSAPDIYVRNNPRDPKEDGTKEHPFDTIQEAVGAVADNQSIYVLPGTYGPTGGSTTIDLGDKKIRIRSMRDPDGDRGIAIAETIIEGQGFSVAGKQGPESQIRGFTIRRGGGVYLENSSPVIVQCVFEYNPGRAITCQSSNARIQSCIFVGNTVSGSDGAGGAIWCSGNPEIVDCTFTGNGAAKGGAIAVAGGSPIISNCILWGDASLGIGDSEIFVAVAGATPSILYCDIQGGTSQGWFGTGDKDIDPLLTADGLLQKGSPCIDTNTGTADLPADATSSDIQGETRPTEHRDVGADQYIDVDADGLPDFWETTYFGGPAAADPDADPDNDGLPNLKEYEASTNPTVADTDGDHWNDGREIACGANPRYPNWYVDVADGNDMFDGRAPAHEGGTHGPKQNIKRAIEKAKSGETIIIAPGIYSGAANCNLDFSQALASGERVITIQSQNPFDPDVVAKTVIDPNGQGRAFYFHDVHSPLSCVQGLTLRNGLAESSTPGGACGGAVLFTGSSPTIAHCTITGNLARQDGGGLYGGARLVFPPAAPTIVDCDISRNEARGSGGGSIAENSAGGVGGGVHSDGIPLDVANCTIGRNTAGQGGGMLSSRCHPTLENCIFSENYGWGMYNSGSNPVLENCIFSGNHGGMYNDSASPTLWNCTFSGNLGSIGAGMLVWTGCSPTLTNCIFWGNGANGDEGEQIAFIPGLSSVVINYSCVQNWSGYLGGVGNIGGDPLFADPGRWDPNGTLEDPNNDFWVNGDYHLKSQAGRWEPNSRGWVQDSVTSPCIDAGDPNNPVADEPKPNGDRINMGAYGGTTEASKSYP